MIKRDQVEAEARMVDSELEQAWLTYLSQDKVKQGLALKRDLAWMESLQKDLTELSLLDDAALDE